MKKILPLVLMVFVLPDAQAEEQKLSRVYEQQLLERVESVFSLGGPREVERPICATPIFVEVNFNRSRFSAKTAELLRSYVSRPDFGDDPEYTYDTPSGHFKIHYTISGEHAVFRAGEDEKPQDGVPDYVNRCADIFDSVWVKEVDGLGFNPPPGDDWYEGNGGDGRYDIYAKNINPLYLGFTDPETSSVANPISYTTYIVVRNDYSAYFSHEDKLDNLRATAAHEFFHAIHMGYDASEFEFDDPDNQNTYKPYWMEMSAVWMEEMVYDGVNDYLGYLLSFFKHPDWSLKTFSYFDMVPDSARHPYGSCVWPMYLQENFDTTIVRDIWDECARVPGNNALDYPGGASATDKALQARGTTFQAAFEEFTVWNYFTGDRARTGVFYSEGDLFPQIRVEHSHPPPEYPVYGPSGPNHPYGLGSNYIVFTPQELQGGARLSFSPASEDYDFAISAIGYNQNANEPVRHEFQINHQTGSAEAEVWNWTSYNQIILIPASVEWNGDSYYPFTYSAEYDSSLHGDQPFPQSDWIGQNFPNPFVIDEPTDLTYFPFVLSSVSQVEIEIFAASGERVWQYPPDEKKGEEWTIGEYTEPGKCPAWNGRNESGEDVAAGVYIYQVKTKSSTVVRKLAVIR